MTGSTFWFIAFSATVGVMQNRALFPLLLLLILSSCSVLSRTPPEVSLVDLEIGEVAVFETTLKVVTRVRNETNQPLNFTGMTHELELNGVQLGKAVNRDHTRLAPLESKLVTSTLELSHLSLAFNIVELINSPKLNYSLSSEFFTSGFGLTSLKSKKSGTLLSEGKSGLPGKFAPSRPNIPIPAR